MFATLRSRGGRGVALLVGLLGIVTAGTAAADCSVIAPEGFDHRSLLGSVSSPFLTPGLSNDVKVVGAICDQATRSSAPDFQVAGVDRPVNDFVITIAFVGAGAPPVLVLGANAAACGADANCTTDTTATREIAQIPLPGGGVERRLRFRVPESLARFGPARVGVKLASDPQPVAFELRSQACDTATGAYVACIDQFYELDGSCRTEAQFVNQPFSGLVAIPKTNFTAICTDGCEDVAPGPVSSTLPVALDRQGNAVFAMVYADQLVRADRGDGVIEPRPRRLSLSIADAVASGFADDAPVVYAAKPSSFTFEGFPLSPPFNPFVDPTAPAGQVGIWGMADAEATVHFLPRRACSDDAAQACTTNSDCGGTATCGAVEFMLAQNGSAIPLPVGSATAEQAFELNSWLDGALEDAAVAVAEDERLSGAPLNADVAADDIVVGLLDRGTGLIKRLNGLLSGRGLTQVRVVEGVKDFMTPAVAAEDRTLAFLESEFAEGLAHPLAATTGAQALAADANGNGRLDQNLRVFALPDDPAAAEALSLLPASLDLAVLPDLRFDGRSNLVLSAGKLFFAYAPSAQQPHAWQLVNQSSDGVAGDSFSRQPDLSSDGRFASFVSGASNLVDVISDEAPGGLTVATPGGIIVQGWLGPNDGFPLILNGKAVFKYVVSVPAGVPAPTRLHLELPVCNTGAGQPDLVASVDLAQTGPNATIQDVPASCPSCAFPGSKVVSFDQPAAGASTVFRLSFATAEIPTGEVGLAFETASGVQRSQIRGPACVQPGVAAGIARVYLRDTETGTTQIASAHDRASCGAPAVVSNQPSGNPDVIAAGGRVFFDSPAALVSDDLDGVSDVYTFDPASCDVTNLSAGLSAPTSDPEGSDDGRFVAFEAGAQIMLLDRTTSALLPLGKGRDPSLSADGSQLAYTGDVEGVSQVFLVELEDGVPGAPVAVSVLGGGLFEAGAGLASVANDARTAFETPPGGVDSDVFVRNVAGAATLQANHLPTLEDVCSASPCGAFSPSISDDGRFLAFVLSGISTVDEVVVQDLVTGSLTPLSRMAGADGHSLEPSLGADGDFVALTSFASALGGVAGAGEPNVFLEAPADPSLERRALLGVLDVAACGAGPCTPTLTSEPVTKGASFAGDVAVVGSPVRVISAAAGGVSVRNFVREGVDVALSGAWVCAITTSDGFGNPGEFAACGSRAGTALSDLTFSGAPLAADRIGLCGQRAIALGANGVLYEANLASGFAARAIGLAEDFELGEGFDADGNGSFDSCLVAFRTLESDLVGTPAQIGNRDLDAADLAMFLLDTEGDVVDCQSSATDCPGQACEQFNYQVGLESVVFLVDEAEENFGFTPAQDPCSPGTDVNEDGLCDLSVRRCTAGGSLTEGTSFGQAGNLFAEGGLPDGENTVADGGYCGTSPENVRFGQTCTSDSDCLARAEESCQLGFVVLSALADSDGDEVPDVFDNCPNVANSDQTNTDAEDPRLDADSVGDACDAYTCGDGLVQDAEDCDEGVSNGTPGSSCSATCGVSSCTVAFKVLTPVFPRSILPTPISVFGSACLNLETRTVGGVPPRSIDANSLRLSASPPTQACPTSGGAPIFDLSADWFYKLHVFDINHDPYKDLNIGIHTKPIGATSATKKLYLTGRFRTTGACFVAEAPVKIAGH